MNNDCETRQTAVLLMIPLLLLVLPSLPYCNKTRPHFTKLDMLWLLCRRFGSRNRRCIDGSVAETAITSNGSVTETAAYPVW